jgi:hypothetical protein
MKSITVGQQDLELIMDIRPTDQVVNVGRYAVIGYCGDHPMTPSLELFTLQMAKDDLVWVLQRVVSGRQMNWLTTALRHWTEYYSCLVDLSNETPWQVLHDALLDQDRYAEANRLKRMVEFVSNVEE